MKKVLISTTTFGEYDAEPLTLLKKAGYSWRTNPYGRKLLPEEVVDLAKDAVGIIAGTETLSAAVLEKLPRLKVISRCGVGLDSVDLAAAARLGIKVTIAGDGIAQAVSELALALALCMLRGISSMDRQIRRQRWNKMMGSLLRDKRVGIVGLGRIGTEAARLFRRNGATVAYHDPYRKKTALPGLKNMGLEDLLKSSDIISLHLSYNSGSKGLIGRRELGLMKETAFLINCSRGGIVDERALCAALKAKRIAGAAVDVFDNEPYSGELTGLDNVVLTPHIGSYAKESRVRMEAEAVTNLIKSLGGKRS